MDRNTTIGLFLIFALFVTWQFLTAPTQEELEARKRAQDSIAALQNIDTTANAQLAVESTVESDTALSEEMKMLRDSMKQLKMSGEFGPFLAAAQGSEKETVLENADVKITFSNKGGKIKEVLLKKYFKVTEDEKKNEVKLPLKLLEDEKNQFEYILPISQVSGGKIKTSDLFFDIAEQTDSSLVFRAKAGEGQYFEQSYVLTGADGYKLNYDVKLEGLQSMIKGGDKVELYWLNYLDKLEKNTTFEKMYSTGYFNVVDDTPDWLSFSGNDDEEIADKNIRWIANGNQFFTTSIIADDDSFEGGSFAIETLDDSKDDLKRIQSQVYLPFNGQASESFDMTLYIGPKDFKTLRALGYDMDEVIPFGWSIFGTINRWVIRPVFQFLSNFISNKGLVILLITIVIKLSLYPLTYKMLHSQSKMAALKPQLESMRAKFKDDQQKQSMEQMKLYRENGVNPAGGCFPLLLQMPIWIALYRFFPVSIEFRQAPFLWATDLSSYDVIARLPFEIPLGFGSHISLFTVLWALTTLVYTYYNSRHMDMSANPTMKYMQYIMPVMFLGFFNSYAAGLTAYLFFGNLINIAQTIITKNYIIDQEKIKKDLEAYRKKPKKKGGFQERLEKALKEQQKVQADREATKKKKKK